MKKDRFMAVVYILIAVIFAAAPAIGTVSNPLIWLAVLIFLGMGIHRLVRAFKK